MQIGKEKAMKKLIIMAVAFICTNAISYKMGAFESESYGHIANADVEVYDSLRNEAYDRAADIVSACKEFYLENDEDEREYTMLASVNEKDREIILTHNTPDLWVLVHAIEDMDDELADGFDNEVIDAYEKALLDYMEYANLL